MIIKCDCCSKIIRRYNEMVTAHSVSESGGQIVKHICGRCAKDETNVSNVLDDNERYLNEYDRVVNSNGNPNICN